MALHSCNDGVDLVCVYNMANNQFIHVEHPDLLNNDGVIEVITRECIGFCSNQNECGYLAIQQTEHARDLIRNYADL
jgi:hypothetical protein